MSRFLYVARFGGRRWSSDSSAAHWRLSQITRRSRKRETEEIKSSICELTVTSHLCLQSPRSINGIEAASYMSDTLAAQAGPFDEDIINALTWPWDVSFDRTNTWATDTDESGLWRLLGGWYFCSGYFTTALGNNLISILNSTDRAFRTVSRSQACFSQDQMAARGYWDRLRGPIPYPT